MNRRHSENIIHIHSMIRRSILTITLAAAGLFAVQTQAAEPKKIIIVTTTTGFRHGSIRFARATLAKLAESSGAFVIADECQQPDITIPRKPNKPKDLAADADENAKKRYANDMSKFEAEMAKWTPEVDADAKAKQKASDEGIAKALEKLSPENLKAKGIDAVIFANTTGPLPTRGGPCRLVPVARGAVDQLGRCQDARLADGRG